MPEYLAPGVYVEEVDTGAKPIEGVSTSTAAMLGVTERGPVNTPILITSYPEFTRWFGGTLNILDFQNDVGAHCYLPHAVQGFFANGGKRVYITRVLDIAGAEHAATRLFDRGDNSTADTVLLRAVNERTGTAANLPLVYALDVSDLDVDDWIRIGNGSNADYRQVAAVGTAATNTHVALNFPLSFFHEVGDNVVQFERFEDTTANGGPYTDGFSLVEAAQVTDTTIEIGGTDTDILALATNVNGGTTPTLIEIGGDIGEYHFAAEVTLIIAEPTRARLRLRSPLALAHPETAEAVPIQLGAVNSANLSLAVRVGSCFLFLDDRGGTFNDREFLVRVDSTADTTHQEVRRIGDLSQLRISNAAYEDYPATSVIEVVTLADDDRELEHIDHVDRTLNSDPGPGDTTIEVDNAAGMMAGDQVIVGAGGTEDTMTILSVDGNEITFADPAGTGANELVHDHGPGETVRLILPDTTIFIDDASALLAGDSVVVGANAPATAETRLLRTVDAGAGRLVFTSALDNAHSAGDVVRPVAKTLTVAASAGSRVIALNNRLSLSVGDVIRVGTAPDDEYVTIDEIPNSTGVAPNSGNVVLEQSLARDHANGTDVRRQTPPVANTGLQPSVLALEATSGDHVLVVSDGDSYTQDALIRVTTPTPEVFYHRLTEDADSSFTPAEVTLSEAVGRPHPTGSAIVGRDPLFEVRALDVGAWGNRLRVSVEDEETGLVPHTTVEHPPINPTTIRMMSLAGVESGSLLELLNPVDGSVIGAPVKVTSIDRAEGTATLSANLTSDQESTLALHGSLNARSREFRLSVFLLRQPDPALPSRNDTVIDSEVFRHLSMDPRHSRYIESIIGDVDGDLRLADRRPEGESWHIRVRDLAATRAAREAVRVGPEALTDLLPDSRESPARLRLDLIQDGYDSVSTLSDGTYIGSDHREPENRTGLFTFRNRDEISIVACPGRTSAQIQTALINHCENMRYRFAVLDGEPPPNDSLNDVQTQRQRYDSKYAALYHPWLLIPDPYPANLAQVADYPIPPSGHMMGIYARTDIERGVHKAPANVVVRGITGLQRALNKGEHDILNPVNINVVRDFRRDNRGIRVWGGRVITSDTDWKYVNVRRLLIFIEVSIDRGLQWVVFEPNAEPLWARVRRAVSNFLTVVWRNGALEGTKPEEAFFVKCDRTTMTQTDIDNGRLICVVGVAPVKPAEFVIIRIGLWTAHADD